MANAGKFSERRAYARPLVQRSVLRYLATGLIVLGMGTIAIGIGADNVFAVTVGMIGTVAGGVWRLWLSVPNL